MVRNMRLRPRISSGPTSRKPLASRALGRSIFLVADMPARSFIKMRAACNGWRSAGQFPRLLIPYHGLLLLAETLDAEAHDVAGLEEPLRLHAHADAGRRAGSDDVARHEGEELREIGDDMVDAEHHGRGRAV